MDKYLKLSTFFLLIVGLLSGCLHTKNDEDAPQEKGYEGESQEEIEVYCNIYKQMKLSVNNTAYPVRTLFYGEYEDLFFALEEMESYEDFPVELSKILFIIQETNNFILLEGNSDGKSLSAFFGNLKDGSIRREDLIITHRNENFSVSNESGPGETQNPLAIMPHLSDTFLKLSGTGMLTSLTDTNDTKLIEFTINEFAFMGTGTAEVFLANSEEIVLTNGYLGVHTYVAIEELIRKNPGVKTLILGESGGSFDDDINMETGWLIRQAGLNTKVLANSSIHSGAVDLFTSGVERIYTRGAVLGVHSWCCGDDGEAANEIPKDHEAHEKQISYFTTMLPETGYDFYFYTLEAAEFDDIHEMSEEEIMEYQLATRIID